MTVHCHDDDRPTVGCEACITARRAAEERARWEQAPVRHVEVMCRSWADGRQIISCIDIEAGIPPDATSRECVREYRDVIVEQFLAALPEWVPEEWTETAVDELYVIDITVGPHVDPPEPVDPHAGMTPLFEATP